MNPASADRLRQTFLDYFVAAGHAQVPSGPLIPAQDPSLMFTNAGMVPFKNVFVGAESRPYSRATSCQKCMRVSGKHNDLEAVGRTTRHHTFFEMLGNFSFGDYFKEEAIVLAWRFVSETLALPKARLWITVFGGAPGLPADTEAAQLWRKISGLPESRIVAKGLEDNFWSMGDTGPCGPCTEIHVDQGNGPVRPEDFDNGRVMEIWNNVFMQFNRQPEGLKALPAPSVDTGMGLERVAALLAGADSNYHTDLFLPLLDHIAHAVGKPYSRSNSEDDVSMRVIADHARASSFLIADGVQPSNEGRGYVLRRIMRRAIRHGRRLGFSEPFFDQACAQVVGRMRAPYPELGEAAVRIGKIAEMEEISFRRTLEDGLVLLGNEMKAAQDRGSRSLEGQVVFKLYDTFGFPKDLTEVIAQEVGLDVDQAGFEQQMEAQRARSRGSEGGGPGANPLYQALAQRLGDIAFVGDPPELEDVQARSGHWRWHQTPEGACLETEVQVLALVSEHAILSEAQAPASLGVVLSPTPFYGEGGGQVGDTGSLRAAGLTAQITDTQRPLPSLAVSQVQLEAGSLKVGQRLWAGYVPSRRRQIRAHHSATHLLHAALRNILGAHVAQAGSRVDAESLRFDFSHFSALAPDVLRTIEADVNRRIAAKAPAEIEVLPYAEAKARGAIALFGEKYGDAVRVIRLGDSTELCGGTHVQHTGEVGPLLILREEAVQSGVRRIEAQAGAALQHSLAEMAQRLGQAEALLNAAAQRTAPTPDLQAAATASPPLGLLLRALEQRLSWAARPGRTDQPPTLAPVKSQLPGVLPVPPMPAPGPYSLSVALQLRDSWQGLLLLLSARASDVAPLAAQLTGAGPAPLLASLAQLLAANRQEERAAAAAHRSDVGAQAAGLLAQARPVAGVHLLAAEVNNLDGPSLRSLADDLRSRLPTGIIALASHVAGKVSLLVTVSADLSGRLAAGKLVQAMAPHVAGRGGGKPQLAQAGGSRPDGIAKALAELESRVRAALEGP